MGLFSKKKNEEVAIDELTPQIKTKLDELAQKGNQFEEEEQYDGIIREGNVLKVDSFNIHLMVNKAVNLKYISFSYNSIFSYTIF